MVKRTPADFLTIGQIPSLKDKVQDTVAFEGRLAKRRA
ncbi:Hypothetical protein Minf_0085 [Methylacidiphilum infernorum V4]|uniref:Uncharacterized protein n=1 Tax=Methylacidiphilum infernorum (isolate V4) TaxID=481448 RepID=B3DX05_METI4|nr:Hypothetical protein Minf_0085 [Methylacidiphilum infernorum V4]